MVEDQVRPSGPETYLSPEAHAERAIAAGRSGEDALRAAISREVREAVRAAVRDAEEIEKLRQSERHYRVFAEQSSDIFWILNLDMKFTYVSPSVERLRGFTPEEVLKQRMDEIFTPASMALVAGNLQGALRNKAAGLIEPHLWQVMELEQLCKDGSTLWTEAAATWLKNEQDQVVGVLGVTRNIDARKRAGAALRQAHEELEQRVVERTVELRHALAELQKKNIELEQLSSALRESENKYRTLVETADAIILVFDRQGRILFINSSGARRMGRWPEELVGRTIAELTSPAEAEQQMGELQRVFDTGEGYSMERRAHGPDAGAHSWFRVSLRPLQDAEGGLHAVMVIATDITNIKKGEEALRVSEARYRTLVETSPDAILLIGTDWRILVANRQAALLHGYDGPEEMQGLPAVELLVPADRDRASANSLVALDKGVLRNIEYQFQRKDGSTFPAEMSVAVVKNEHGELIAFQGIAHDITERKKAEERERRHQEELRQADKLAALGGLVSGVAHEINNPNHVISLNIATFQTIIPELLARLDRHAEQHGDLQVGRLPWAQVREEAPRLLEDVRMASNRIKRIVTDLKEYARPDGVEPPAPFDLNAAVEDAVNLMRSVLRKATDRFELDLTPVLPVLFGRKRRIEQIVINLLQNACQALSGARQAVRVRTYPMQGPLCLVVEVQDEGGGIAPEHLSRLTDPFFTTKREKGGTGLGLAVSLSIARDHGGELEFQSVPGQGTIARLVLPIPPSSPQELQ